MTIMMITMMVTAKATKYDSQLMNRNRNWLILIQVSGFWGRTMNYVFSITFRATFDTTEEKGFGGPLGDDLSGKVLLITGSFGLNQASTN